MILRKIINDTRSIIPRGDIVCVCAVTTVCHFKRIIYMEVWAVMTSFGRTFLMNVRRARSSFIAPQRDMMTSITMTLRQKDIYIYYYLILLKTLSYSFFLFYFYYHHFKLSFFLFLDILKDNVILFFSYFRSFFIFILASRALFLNLI